MSRERERITKAVAEHADTPHPELFARIAVYGQKPDDTDKAVVLALSASMPGQEGLQTRRGSGPAPQWTPWPGSRAPRLRSWPS